MFMHEERRKRRKPHPSEPATWCAFPLLSFFLFIYIFFFLVLLLLCVVFLSVGKRDSISSSEASSLTSNPLLASLSSSSPKSTLPTSSPTSDSKSAPLASLKPSSDSDPLGASSKGHASLSSSNLSSRGGTSPSKTGKDEAPSLTQQEEDLEDDDML